MPELPDVAVYVEALAARVKDRALRGVRLSSSFLLRTVEPALAEFTGRRVVGVERLGKRIVLAFEGELYLVLHLMIAGRLHWHPPGKKLAGKLALAAFDFDEGALVLTEAGTKKRASLHAVRGRAGLAEHDRGGLEVLACDLAAFRATLARENRTLKRALTDPTLFSGIGNAYSDEILHAARLSPVKRTHALTDAEISRLFDSVVQVLSHWTDRLRADFGMGSVEGLALGGRFPRAGQITAFREGFAVHGRFGKPCPACGSPVQRIRSAENECNYCARCQNGGVVLADRSLSRLLKDDWPRRIEDWE